jgi:hypothetical protein
MKRTTETDVEWDLILFDMKVEAERRMKIQDNMKGLTLEADIKAASRAWACSQHSAEMRLIRGELV